MESSTGLTDRSTVHRHTDTQIDTHQMKTLSAPFTLFTWQR